MVLQQRGSKIYKGVQCARKAHESALVYRIDKGKFYKVSPAEKAQAVWDEREGAIIVRMANLRRTSVDDPGKYS